ncbi:MAG: hypothetical protein WAZ21_03595 [Candidatus Saccharimonadales bacterium]
MKVTVVPAQVTTVEDRITGNLSVSQIALFAVPVFGGSLLYAALPPSMEFSIYKLVVIGFLAIITSLLAIRIKGKIVLVWALILLRYGLRPRLYLFNKNTAAYREDYPEPLNEAEARMTVKEHVPAVLPKLGIQETAYVYATLDDPISRLRFETTKKGGLHVRITEVQE